MRSLRAGYCRTKMRSRFLAGCSPGECVSLLPMTATPPPSTRHWPESHTVRLLFLLVYFCLLHIFQRVLFLEDIICMNPYKLLTH